MQRRVRYLVTGAAILVVAWYAFERVRNNPGWRNFNSDTFLSSLAQIRIPELMGAVLLIYSTYLLRSLRWQEFLRPVKRASLPNLLAATILGFGALAVFGRTGELVRPYLIAQKEEVPVSGQLAVWLLERFYDTVAIILVVSAAAVFTGAGEDTTPEFSPVLARMRRGGIILMALTVAAVVLLVLYEKHLKTWEPRLLGRLGFLPPRYREAIRDQLHSFGHGLASVRSGRALALGAVYSLLVWLAITCAFWLALQAFGPPVDDLSFSSSILVMGFAIAGSLIQLPGVGGGTQVATIIALTEFYGVPPEVATSAGLVLWGITFIAVVPVSIVLFLHEGLTWRSLRVMTRGVSEGAPLPQR